jgi:hypothetical protein
VSRPVVTCGRCKHPRTGGRCLCGGEGDGGAWMPGDRGYPTPSPLEEILLEIQGCCATNGQTVTLDELRRVVEGHVFPSMEVAEALLSLVQPPALKVREKALLDVLETFIPRGSR